MDPPPGSALECAVKEFAILVACHQDHTGLFGLRDELLESPQLIAQYVRVHQQHIGVKADGLGETLWVLALSDDSNIGLICNRTAQSDKGKWLIVRDHKTDITHKIHSHPAPIAVQSSRYLLSQNGFQGHEKIEILAGRTPLARGFQEYACAAKNGSNYVCRRRVYVLRASINAGQVWLTTHK